MPKKKVYDDLFTSWKHEQQLNSLENCWIFDVKLPAVTRQEPILASRLLAIQKLRDMRSLLIGKLKYFKFFKFNSQTSLVFSDPLKHENLVLIAVYQSCMQGWCEMNDFGQLCAAAHFHSRLRKGNNCCMLRKKHTAQVLMFSTITFFSPRNTFLSFVLFLAAPRWSLEGASTKYQVLGISSDNPL